ncbi:MAG: NYN domain-containing protein, partial [Thermicanus sp.]|nr:NYN domain-containing protein [Thermicanus sp.]
MVKSIALILDGGFVFKKMPQSSVSAKDIYDFALSCIDRSSEELFRIYFYHCLPYDETEIHPISGEQIDFKTSNTAQRNRQLFSELAEMNHVALRKGRLVFRGWTIKKYTIRRLQNQMKTIQQLAATSQHQQPVSVQNQGIQATNADPLTANDFEAEFTQKEVDIKIGLDVAWLSSRKIVDKIILVTGDTDLVPAMKFARREGVQVVVINIIVKNSNKNDYLKAPLKEHADEIRSLC